MTPERGGARANRERFISASELAEFAYCRRAWWLRMVRGEEGEGESLRFDEGRAMHRRLFWRLAIARALAAAAVFFALAALVFWLVIRA